MAGLACHQALGRYFALCSARALSEIEIVVLVKSDLIDKLGVAVLSSIPFRPLILGSPRGCFRLLPEPGGPAAGSSRAPSPDRGSSSLCQAAEADYAGSIAVGWAVRRMARVAVRYLPRPSLHRDRLAPPRLSPVLELENSAGPAGAAEGAEGSPRLDSYHEP